MEKRNAIRKNAIEGLVIPHKWDERGKIIGIAIYTDKEEIYLVTHNRIEGELLNQLHIKVRLEGKTMECSDGSKLISVRSFQPFLGNSNDGEDC